MAKTKGKRQNVPKVDSVDEKLAQSNEAYSQFTFSFLRCLVHTLGAGQFIYGIYFWHNIHWNGEESEEDKRADWGGKFRFLTFLDVILQAAYHCIAILNDFFGSNAVNPQPIPVLRKLKDFMFAALAFPIAQNVCISFWVVYAYDRELIFPKALDAIFPNWLNHVVHTNVSMLIIMDLFTCFRKYPQRTKGLVYTIAFMVLYLVWMNIARYYSGQWVYPMFEVLSMPFRFVMMGAMIVFTVICYLMGEFVNEVVWSPELKLLKQKEKKQ